MLQAVLVAAIVIFIAEQGDKTQLLAFSLATRYRAWQVLLGIFFVNAGVLLIVVLAGRLVGTLVPGPWLVLFSGLGFVVFGTLTLSAADESVNASGGRFQRFGPVLTTAGLFFLAEIGDQAELVTAAVAANPAGPLSALTALGGGLGAANATRLGLVQVHTSPAATLVGVWLGAIIGIMLADGIGIAAGRVLGHRLPQRLLRRASGIAFLLLGALVTGVGVWGLLGR